MIYRNLLQNFAIRDLKKLFDSRWVTYSVNECLIFRLLQWVLFRQISYVRWFIWNNETYNYNHWFPSRSTFNFSSISLALGIRISIINFVYPTKWTTPIKRAFDPRDDFIYFILCTALKLIVEALHNSINIFTTLLLLTCVRHRL